MEGITTVRMVGGGVTFAQKVVLKTTKKRSVHKVSAQRYQNTLTKRIRSKYKSTAKGYLLVLQRS